MITVVASSPNPINIMIDVRYNLKANWFCLVVIRLTSLGKVTVDTKNPISLSLDIIIYAIV